jgi:hypothetical protein
MLATGKFAAVSSALNACTHRGRHADLMMLDEMLFPLPLSMAAEDRSDTVILSRRSG